MGIVIRLLLIAASLSTTLYILKRIRHAKLQIEYAIFWLLFAGILLIISIFPSFMIMLTRAVGMQSPINCVFLLVIFTLMIKLFMQTIEHSQLEDKLKQLTQRLAIEEKLREEEIQELNALKMSLEQSKIENKE
ncbi:MAG: DUF2304 domain-containing protein [Lachnospiraceae bacterium]|nr:DUF2304 domain-containing protein [Lachnospiraceae bacterium]